MKTLITQDQIRTGVAQLGRELNVYYSARPLTVIGVLTGSVMLLADLIRQLDMPLCVGVIQARSYRGAATQPGDLSINTEFLPPIGDRDILLVDDIFDTGHTLSAVMAQLASLAPRSLRSAVLLRKRGRQRVSVWPDHVVFEIPDRFVVGYGLDYNDAYRNLPYIAALDAQDVAPAEFSMESPNRPGVRPDHSP